MANLIDQPSHPMSRLQALKGHSGARNRSIPDQDALRKVMGIMGTNTSPIHGTKSSSIDQPLLRQPNTSQIWIVKEFSSIHRYMVHCHDCARDWYQDDRGMRCPMCGSDFTEVIKDYNYQRDSVLSAQGDDGERRSRTKFAESANKSLVINGKSKPSMRWSHQPNRISNLNYVAVSGKHDTQWQPLDWQPSSSSEIEESIDGTPPPSSPKLFSTDWKGWDRYLRNGSPAEDSMEFSSPKTAGIEFRTFTPTAKIDERAQILKTNFYKHPERSVDVERQCGVLLPNGSLCARSLTCKGHSMGAKRSVTGRSKPYDTLLEIYNRRRAHRLPSIVGQQQSDEQVRVEPRPGPSPYWSVSELQDFDKNLAHFGTDWLAIANHMGTKTHIMIQNQFLRLVESGRVELERIAKEADIRRERGDNLGPPPTPTPAPKRRYDTPQTTSIRQSAHISEHKSPANRQIAPSIEYKPPPNHQIAAKTQDNPVSKRVMSYTISQDCTSDDSERKRARLCALKDRSSRHKFERDEIRSKKGF